MMKACLAGFLFLYVHNSIDNYSYLAFKIYIIFRRISTNT